MVTEGKEFLTSFVFPFIVIPFGVDSSELRYESRRGGGGGGGGLGALI